MTQGRHSNTTPTAAPAVRLRLLATTDLHGHLTGYDYVRDLPSPDTGLARVASLIRQARAEAPNTLLFDNGDFLQGSPLVDDWARAEGRAMGALHPMIAAMNALGYDGATLGNHEFNFGLEVLLEALAGAAFPIVSANALRARAPCPTADHTLLAPWQILSREVVDASGARQILRLGVIGLLPPQTALWDRAVLGGALHTRGIVTAARAHVPLMRAAGADLVVALTHSGVAAPLAPDAADSAENAALEVAALAGVDALICGHTHKLFPDPSAPALAGFDPRRGTLHGKPAVMPGRWGSHLGVIDLDLARGPTGAWRVAGFQTEVRPVAAPGADGNMLALAAPDPELMALARPAHEATLRQIRHPLGQLASPMQSFFAQVAPDAGLSLLAEVQRNHVASRLSGTAKAALPLLSAVAPYRCGGRGGPEHFVDLPAGPLPQRAIASLLPFHNTAVAVQVRGADLVEWLERAASAFCQIVPGQADQPLLDAAFPSYNFDVIFGLSYEIDPSQPARYTAAGALANPRARRISNITFAGAPLDLAQDFVVASNSYRNSGAGGFVEASGPPLDLGAVLSAQEMLTEAVQRRHTIAPRAERVWRFAPLPGTSAVFQTSRRASGRLALAEGVRLEEIGPTPDGFLQIRLHF